MAERIMSDNKVNFAILGIVAIVGIVAVVSLFSNAGINASEDLAGQATMKKMPGAVTNYQKDRLLVQPPRTTTTTIDDVYCQSLRTEVAKVEMYLDSGTVQSNPRLKTATQNRLNELKAKCNAACKPGQGCR